jgi:hypothetical protein
VQEFGSDGHADPNSRVMIRHRKLKARKNRI